MFGKRYGSKWMKGNLTQESKKYGVNEWTVHKNFA